LKHKRRSLGWVAALLALSLVAAACGGDDGGSDGGTDEGEPVRGGILKMAGLEDFDHLDPAQQYFQLTNAMLKGVVRTLVWYETVDDPETPTKLVPDLATDTGTPNEDDTEWTFTLKDDIVWGPALGGEEIEGVTGEPITSQDVAYAFDRIFMKSVGNQYSFYFDMLDEVETPDDKTVVFKLKDPTPDWPQRLAFTAAAPVPESYASEFDQKKTSDYDNHVVASGPYYIEEYTPGEGISLRRNEYWSNDDQRAAYLDGVDWQLGFEEPNVVAQKIFDGEFHFSYDGRPQGPLLERAFTDEDLNANILQGPAAATRYIFLNTEVEPFDDPLVREAVNLAIDRDNMRRVYGGEVVGDIACSVLPPGIPGHLPCEEYNPFESESMAGNMEEAQALIEESGADLGSAEVFMVGATDDPHDKLAESVRTDLEELGFTNIDPKLVAFPNQYTQFYSVPDKKVAVGPAAGWVWDWPDAMTFFDPLFNGNNIGGAGTNNNYSMLDDPEINEAIEAAKELEPGSEEYATAMEEINRLTTESAVWIPWLWDIETLAFNAENVGGTQWDPSNGSAAYWQMYLKDGGESQ
jgi:peptide/nickel transport system substrate-binding protein